MTRFQITFVNSGESTQSCFCLFIGTRVPDTQSCLADNLCTDALKCPTAQSSVTPADDAGAAAEVGLPSGGRKDEHVGPQAEETCR